MVSFKRLFRRVNPIKIWFLLTTLSGIGLAVIFIIQLNTRLHPILLELALAQTANRLTAVVDQAVADQAISYHDLVILERSENGDIVALTSNMAQANILRAQLLEVALSALGGLETIEMEIPIGTILDWDILSGKGPGINIRILHTGTACAEFENEFSSAGINQTCHQINFSVHADIAVLLPGQQYRETVSTTVCVAETVIVGDVPGTYLHLGQ